MKENKANKAKAFLSLIRGGVRRGFTLLEVLIVVLIVAILSAIAVPQYQKAVLKSRFSSLMPTTQAIRDGNEMYYMTNGGYADALNKLDVSTANTEDMTITLSNDSDYAYTTATRPNIKNNLIMYQKHSVNFPGEVHCEALTGDTRAEWLCDKGMHATKNLGEVLTAGYTTYVLAGIGDGLTLAQREAAEENGCKKADALGIECSITELEGGEKEKKVCYHTTVDGDYCVAFSYDADGKLTKRASCFKRNNDTCTKGSEYTYDENGNILEGYRCTNMSSSYRCDMYEREEYENGQLKSTTSCGRLLNDGSCNVAFQKTIQIGTTTIPVGWVYASNETYEYDPDGRFMTTTTCDKVATNGDCIGTEKKSITYYDEAGNVLASGECTGTNPGNACLQLGSSARYYSYNDVGQVISDGSCFTVNSEGTCQDYNRQTAYFYNADGSLAYTGSCTAWNANGTCSSVQAGTAGTVYVYNPDGKLNYSSYCSSMKSDGSCGAVQTGSNTDSEYYYYDHNGKLSRQEHCDALDASGACTRVTSYVTYDENGEKVAEIQCGSISGSECLDKSYTYY